MWSVVRRVSSVRIDGERFGQLLASRGLSLAAAAAASGVSERTIRTMRAGGFVAAPTLKRVYEAVNALPALAGAELVAAADELSW